MRALRFETFGAPSVLHLVDVADPQPRDGFAIVRVTAASINPSDVKNVAGAMEGTVLPRTPGRDFAGVVERGPDDWMARYFFTGGMMPSKDLLPGFDRDLRCVERWRLDGTHYQRTSEAWLARMDANSLLLRPVLMRTYGDAQARLWCTRWRIFFMACAELWGYRGGSEWIVAHYLFEKARRDLPRS